MKQFTGTVYLHIDAEDEGEAREKALKALVSLKESGIGYELDEDLFEF